jgi:transcription elongation factor Elf1
MADQQKCPYCGKGSLDPIELETTYTDTTFACKQCGKKVVVKSGLGKAAQVAPVALGVGAIIGVLISIFTGHDTN